MFELYAEEEDGIEADSVFRKVDFEDPETKALFKEFTEEEVLEGKRLYAYAVLKTSNSDSTIRYGTFDLNLYKPPIRMRKRMERDMLKPQSVVVSVLQNALDE